MSAGPYFMAAVMFGVYALSGGDMSFASLPSLFAGMVVLMQIRLPLMILPQILVGLAVFSASVKRVNTVLSLEDMKPPARITDREFRDGELELRACSFDWGVVRDVEKEKRDAIALKMVGAGGRGRGGRGMACLLYTSPSPRDS